MQFYCKDERRIFGMNDARSYDLCPLCGKPLLNHLTFDEAIKQLEDRQQALALLDKAGVWTGADLMVYDRVASLIRDWQEQQRKIVELQAEVGHLKNELTSR